jgi:dCMP deaminase
MECKNVRSNADRPSLDEKFMMQAFVSATSSSCLKLNTGVKIVSDKRVRAEGYNGAPAGIKSSLEHGVCRKDSLGIDFDEKGTGTCRGRHAEENAMSELSREQMIGATMYTVYYPCGACAKSIVGNGIKRVVYAKVYNDIDDLAEELFREGGVQVDHLDFDPKNFQKYFDALK